MSTGLFSIARSALLTHQAVLQTISQNIANAETPGYSRQEAVLEANVPVRMPYGNVGTGVHIATIGRKRDLLLDDADDPVQVARREEQRTLRARELRDAILKLREQAIVVELARISSSGLAGAGAADDYRRLLEERNRIRQMQDE